MNVFLVMHAREKANGEEDLKLIGIYSSLAEAEDAVGRARELPGFRDSPAGFSIDRYELGRDHWTCGFGW